MTGADFGLPDRAQSIFEGLCSIFQISVYLPEDHDVEKLLKNMAVAKCLGMQQSLLTYKGEVSSRMMIPWTIVNLRQVIIVFRSIITNPSPADAGATGTFHQSRNRGDSLKHITELPTTVLGLVKWALDLMTYICANIVRMASLQAESQQQSDPSSEGPTLDQGESLSLPQAPSPHTL